MAAAAAVVSGVVVAAAVGLTLVRSDGPSLTDRTAIEAQVRSLVTDDGLVAAPAVANSGTLEATAWLRLMEEATGHDDLRPDPERVEELVAELDGDPWDEFFAGHALASPAVQTRRVVWPSLPEVSATEDVAAVALAYWAGDQVQELGEKDRLAVSDWVSEVLASCSQNSFVSAHLLNLRVALEPGVALRDAGKALVNDCPDIVDEDAAPAVPETEQQLLTATGDALVLGAADRLDGPAAARIREALEPRHVVEPDDPWWVYYSMRGYVGAGGDPQDYADAAAALGETKDEYGLASPPAQSVPTLETTYQAARVFSQIGVAEPEKLTRHALELHTALGAGWGDADWALYGAYLHEMGLEPTDRIRNQITQSAGRCAVGRVTAQTAAGAAVCWRGKRAFGADERPEVDWDSWRGLGAAATLRSAWLLEASPPASDVEALFEEMGEDVTNAPTASLAGGLVVAHRAGVHLDEDLVEQIEDEIADRRTDERYDALYAESAAVGNANFFSTMAVLDWENTR